MQVIFCCCFHNLNNNDNKTVPDNFYYYIQRVSHSSHIYELEKDVKPFKEEFGTRIFIRCDEISFKLLAPLETEKGPLCQVSNFSLYMYVCISKNPLFL